MKLIIEPTPHIRSKNSTAQIMLGVILAALPAMIASTAIFGLRAAILIITCVCACVFFEFTFRLLFKRPQTITDLSAVVTGVLLAFNLPVTLPLYMAVIGCFVAIVVTKEMFGGLGQNFANPAIVGRIVLMLSFPSYMGSYVMPFYYRNGVDAITAPTPLAVESAEQMPPMLDLFLGVHGGSLGETCALALLIGFAYLLIMKIIRPVTPLMFIGTIAVGTYIMSGDISTALVSILTGGLLLGAIFMATDYSTNPMTLHGKIIFGFGCGLISLVIRQFGGMPEGVAFSILTMNILTPFIDKITRPKPFGMKKEEKIEEK
jgi:electron transport complex protein RnfD